MKTACVLLALVASASAYAPLFATRAVGKAKPAAASSGPPESKGYPSFRDAAEKVRFGNVSGGGNKAPPQYFKVPDFSNPAKQIERDPAFYAEAAKTRKSKAFRGVTGEYVYEDGLTDLERKQRATIPMFLSGSAKSQKDVSTIRDDIETDELIFGLDPDRFQLLFIAVFGLFTLVGSLSGNLNL